MGKAIKKYANGLSIRYVKRSNRYYITHGVNHVMINDQYHFGTSTFEEAEQLLLNLKPSRPSNHLRWYAQ